jgi:integrase
MYACVLKTGRAFFEAERAPCKASAYSSDPRVFPRKNNAGKITSYRGAYFGPDGKRRYVLSKTKEEARHALRETRSGADQGLVFAAAKLTVAEYLDRWLKDSVQSSLMQSTYQSYCRQTRRYIAPSVGRVRLKALTPAHVQGLYREMQERGLSARTVEYTHAVLHRALKQAMRWSMVPRNVCDAVYVPQVRREEMHPLTPEQARRFLDAARGERLEALYIVAVHVGLRPGELLALRWEDVDLDRGILHVRRALSNGEFTTPKTKRSRRRIDLSVGSVAALQRHRTRQAEERMARAGLWQNQGLVFPSSVGTLLSHRNVVRSFKSLLTREGMPDAIRPYDLRHTCASLLCRNVHPKYVQELLGHASIAQTLDTYSHVLPGMDGGTGDAIEEVLG